MLYSYIVLSYSTNVLIYLYDSLTNLSFSFTGRNSVCVCTCVRVYVCPCVLRGRLDYGLSKCSSEIFILFIY